jgi:hypothetical protein
VAEDDGLLLGDERGDEEQGEYAHVGSGAK